ncbi:ABC transporter permease [Kaarinaea lacus]
MSTSITTLRADKKLERLLGEGNDNKSVSGNSSYDASATKASKNIDQIEVSHASSDKNIHINLEEVERIDNANNKIKNRREKPIPWSRYAVRTAAIVGAIIVWHLCSTFSFNFIISFENIPKPTVVGSQFITLLGTEDFYTHIVVSLKRILIGFLLASLLGVIAGVFMGRSKIISDILMPYIEILRPIPAVAWIPLAILMLPTEESSIIYITFLGAFFPIVLNTVHGVEQTEETLVRAAKSLGASNFSILWHVIIPGALPSIMAGLAIGMGVSWFSLLAGEIISGQYGIGYFTWNSYTLVEYPNIIIGMLVIGGLGTLSTWLVKQASKPALRWQEQQQ